MIIHSPRNHRALERLLGLGKADGVVANVVDTVPAAQERVTQDSQGTDGLREVHAHEAADAGALDLQDVVKGADREGVAGQSEGEVGQRVTLGTVHGVLTVPALGGTNLLVPEGGQRVYLTIRGYVTYKSSAMVVGRAIREVPVSRMTPVFSSSATLSPRAMESRSTSQ